MKKALIASAIGLFFTVPEAEAILFNFSYVTGTGTLAGQFSGTVQPDLNTVVITAFLDFVTWNGVAGPSLPLVQSADAALLGFSGLLPTVTLDNSFIDFTACLDVVCADGFTLSLGNSTSATFGGGSPVWGSGPSFGDVPLATFDPADWTVSPIGRIPVPSTLPLFAIGGAALAWYRRKAA